MDTTTAVDTCDHAWRYYVDLRSRGVRVRECERCGQRVVMARGEAPQRELPLSA